LDFVGYGGNDTVADPATYGWPSHGIQDAAISFFAAGAQSGLHMDWAQTSSQGSGLPLSSPDDAGAAVSLLCNVQDVVVGANYTDRIYSYIYMYKQRELARGTIGVQQGSSYSGVAPPPLFATSAFVLNQTLIAVVAAKSSSPLTNDTYLPSGLIPSNSTSIPLDFPSLQVLTFDSNNQISFTASDGNYLIFSFWARSTGQVSAVGGFNGNDPSSRFRYLS
jgi:hypothetical protein